MSDSDEMSDSEEPIDDVEPEYEGLREGDCESPETDNVAETEKMTGSPLGIRRPDQQGLECVDALAGRSSVFGFGFAPITDTIQQAAEQYLGDSAALLDQVVDGDDRLLVQFQELMGESGGVSAESIFVCSSADMAVETAIAEARIGSPDSAYRTITLLGSDYGRSGVCRTASGRPELHEGYGPMMAGFAHVPAGDIDALRAAADEQTACILLSPVDFADASRPLDFDYLTAVRKLCDDRGIVLVVDESRLCFASSGRLFAFTSIADIQADAVILGGGLFGGLAGGIVLASSRLTPRRVIDTSGCPMLVSIASVTLEQMILRQLPSSADESMQEFAVSLAEQISGFEFVRDVHALGMTFGIETDIDAVEIVQAAARRGLRLEVSGDTAVRLQLPLVVSEEDREGLLLRLGEAMEMIECATTEMGA